MSTEAVVAVTHPRRAVIDRRGVRSGPAWKCSAARTAARCGAPSSGFSTRWCCVFGPTPSFPPRSLQTMSPRRCTTSSSARVTSYVRQQHGSSCSNVSVAGCASPAERPGAVLPGLLRVGRDQRQPAQPDSGAAEAVLRDIHADRDRTAIEALNVYASDGLVIEELSDQLRSSWHDVRAGAEITRPFLAGLTTVLGPADTHGAAPPGSESGRR